MKAAMDIKLYFLCLDVALLLCVVLMSRSALIEAAQEGALVTQLPGFSGPFPSKHYSGYITIMEEKNLFYYFVVSERNPSTDPVVLWLNGGPGCSSFDGFVSNIIYLDSPAGVGFSYSKNHSKYETGDLMTAADTHTFLLKVDSLYSYYCVGFVVHGGYLNLIPLSDYFNKDGDRNE
ncbi:unnamed protein product [Dovyalis caffra]|uniref:Uncharacterized protein n=1 Tax=Dovyalis caffra TaxID=77055 RepID=A0AAV1RWD6_9ROSI|nr:unnamed protein product [Dovyalis caffra]